MTNGYQTPPEPVLAVGCRLTGPCPDQREAITTRSVLQMQYIETMSCTDAIRR